MAVCNIFNKLSKPTGNFLTFSQYSEDLTRGATQYEAYRVVPSKFVVMDIDYSKVNTKLFSYLSDEEVPTNLDLNEELPRYFQNYFENGCAYLKGNYNGDLNPKHSANMFWNTLYKADMLTTTEDSNLNYFINEVRYIGDINIQSYDEKYGDGFSEIYCYIPSDAKAYKYGTIDLKPDESMCDCAPYTAKEVDDRIQYIDPYTIDYEPWTGEEGESLEMYADDPQMWSGKTVCQCGCESYDSQEVKDALEECNCYPYTPDDIKNRIYNINDYTSVGGEIPQTGKNWSGVSECKFKDDEIVSYERSEVSTRITNINPITMTELGNEWDGEDGNIEDYQDNPDMWSNDENLEHHAHYQTNEIKNSIYEMEGIDKVLPVDSEEENEEDKIVESTDPSACECCVSLTEKEIENRIESLNPKTAVSVAEDWKYLANYSDNPNIWDDPEALAELFEEVDYEIMSDTTNSAIRNYYNENDYLEGFDRIKEYSIKDIHDSLRTYYADNSLVDKEWIDSRPQTDTNYTDNYKFNTIIVLYEIHKVDNSGNWVLYEDYKNIPLGIYFTGMFNKDFTLTNPVTKYIDNDEIYKEGTAYGLRICYRFGVTPNNVSIKSVDIKQENDNYSAFCQVMTEMSRTQEKMNSIISSCINQTQYMKDTLSMFRNNRTNVPYLKEINGENFWFVNGKFIGKATVTQTTPIYIENTTVFPNKPTIEDIDTTPSLDNPIQFAPVNTTSFDIKNNGYVGENADEDIIIEVDYGNVELINEPIILTDWIKEIKEIN